MRKEAAYLKLYRRLRQDIVDGVYRPGSRLPSKRVLAERFGVSVVTVQHALDILGEEGYLTARERSGCYAAYQAEAFLPGGAIEAELPPAAPERHGGEEFPFPQLAKAMRKVLGDYGGRLLVKSPNNGCRELREAIAGYLAASRGIRVPAGRIVIGSGAEYLYGLIVQMLGRDRVFALEDPSYEMIRRVYGANGVVCDLLKLGPDGIRPEALAATRATVLHVTPFHSWPSGVTASASRRADYVRWARERHGFVVEDDFDSEFTVSSKAEDTVFSLDPEETVIYLNTFSRTVAPSLRVGYMVLPAALQETFRRRVGFYSCTVPVTEQYLLAELIRSGEFQRHINRVRRARRKNGQEGG